MSGKYKNNFGFVVLLMFIFTLVTGASAEVIKVSRLKRERSDFSIKRDIFSPGKLPPDAKPAEQFMPPPPPKKTEEQKKQEAQEKKIEDEILRSVHFEGYVLKENRNHALISVNGEFFVAGVGDIVGEKIKIVKIDREMVTVEVDTKTIEIKIKEVEENEETEMFQDIR